MPLLFRLALYMIFHYDHCFRSSCWVIQSGKVNGVHNTLLLGALDQGWRSWIVIVKKAQPRPTRKRQISGQQEKNQRVCSKTKEPIHQINWWKNKKQQIHQWHNVAFKIRMMKLSTRYIQHMHWNNYLWRVILIVYGIFNLNVPSHYALECGNATIPFTNSTFWLIKLKRNIDITAQKSLRLSPVDSVFEIRRLINGHYNVDNWGFPGKLVGQFHQELIRPNSRPSLSVSDIRHLEYGDW